MIGPAASASVAGTARLEVQLVAGRSAVTSAFASSPLKLLCPRSRGDSVWAYTSSFGGGMLGGDQTRLDVRVGQGARCFLSTQAATKVYRNPRRLPCGHVTRASLDSGAALVFAPDPVQPFAGSSYEQVQEWRLAPDSGLVLLDWFSAGRMARGERWQFDHFRSRNDVFIGEKRVLVDSIVLEGGDDLRRSPHRTGKYECFAMLLFIGAPWQPFAKELLQDVGSRPVASGQSLLYSVSPVRDGALLRVAGERTEEVSRELQRHLQLISVALGDNPWIRKW